MNNNKSNAMVVSFLSYSEQNNSSSIESNRQTYNYLSWSAYDRISVKSADNFEKLCKPHLSESNRWTGIEQYLNLVEDKLCDAYDLDWDDLKSAKKTGLICSRLRSGNRWG